MSTTRPPNRVRDDEALRLILENTVTQTGTAFFRALVRNLARAIDASCAWVTEYLPEQRRLRSLAFWIDGRYIEDFEYCIDGTPCEPVIDRACTLHLADRLLELYPGDPDLKAYKAVSYIGVPLLDLDGTVVGNLAAFDSRPMPEEPHLLPVFEIFAARAAAEYRRLKAEADLRAREQQMARLLETAMDGILVLDGDMRICRANPAAGRIFGCDPADLVEQPISRLCVAEGKPALHTYAEQLAAGGDVRPQIWIPQDLMLRRADRTTFPAEATLSRFDSAGRTFYTLILRNIDDRIEAQRRIQQLTDETEYLREAARDLGIDEDLIGRSPGMQELFRSIEKVAPTDATVLLLGETGTGKECVARAIHRASRRAGKPMIRVNCAAIPAALIESEFFGHEKGAFTGATARREGRFAMADGGTIFLDEIGELPLDLQAKLLRILQEGEFEPVGSGHTRRVDVRVIAATNRDLQAMVEQGRFRQDLFYRLSVIPLRLPALRERGDDIAILASAFLERDGRRMGRRFPPLRDEDIRILAGYSWPGNVRELQNVIERAIILSPDGRLDLRLAMPAAAQPASQPCNAAAPGIDASPTMHAVPVGGEPPVDSVLTDAQLRDLERRNMERALRASGGKVAGPDGAAAKLGLPASTFASRMKALGIRRPEPAAT